jgi:hypothetical protein
MTFNFRAFEMHGHRMWQRRHIIQALDFIQAYQLNALVLHESDIIHQLVFPRAWFDPYAQWKGAPTRRGENALQNNRVYFDHILNLAANRGVPVWLEVKELAFPDEVLEAHPELIKGGVVCPSEPIWLDFITCKTEELLEDFPSLAGIILSPGSPEGRAARSQNKCHCELCGATPLTDWYDGIIRAMHTPLARHGKRLAVREFAYTPADHAPLIEAVSRQPDDVILCCKVTPHDFYPTFPDNPALGRLKREQWIEYDTQGQFYGWGVIPCFMADDIRRRVAYGRGQGVTGGVFRTEWERINDFWSLETLNVLNTIAAAMLARDPQTTDLAICARWLGDAGYPEAAAPFLAGVLAETWPIMRGALYIDDFLFSDCSMFPRSIGRAWWTMELKHSLADWAPEYRGRLELDSARIDELLAEKRRACDAAAALVARLDQTDAAVPDALRQRLREAFALLPVCTQGMALCAEVCLRARWQQRAPTEADRAAFVDATDRLAQFGESLRPLCTAAAHPHQTVMILDHRRVADIVRDARAIA